MVKGIREFEILDLGGLVESITNEASDAAVVGAGIEGFGLNDHNELSASLTNHGAIYGHTALVFLPVCRRAACFLYIDTHLPRVVFAHFFDFLGEADHEVKEGSPEIAGYLIVSESAGQGRQHCCLIFLSVFGQACLKVLLRGHCYTGAFQEDIEIVVLK